MAASASAHLPTTAALLSVALAKFRRTPLNVTSAMHPWNPSENGRSALGVEGGTPPTNKLANRNGCGDGTFTSLNKVNSQ